MRDKRDRNLPIIRLCDAAYHPSISVSDSMLGVKICW